MTAFFPGRQGWLRITWNYKCIGSRPPGQIEIHEVGCKGREKDDTPINGCSSDAQRLGQSFGVPMAPVFRQGSFRISVGSETTDYMPHSTINLNGMKEALEALPNVQEVTIIHYEGTQTGGKLWQIAFHKQGGHHYDITASGLGDDAATHYLYPTHIPIDVTLEEAGGETDWFFDPMPLYLVGQASQTSSVALTVHNIRALCTDGDGNCKFEYNGTLTPSVSSIACIAGTLACPAASGNDELVAVTTGNSIVLSGSMMGTAAVRLGTGKGAIDCAVYERDAAAGTVTKCMVPHMTAGIHPVQLIARRGGLADFVKNIDVSYIGAVTSIGDAAAGDLLVPVSGGSTLAIEGTGFSLDCEENAISIAGQTCVCTSATYSRVECTTPAIDQAIASWGETLSVTLVAVRVGLFGLAVPQKLQYTWDVTPKYLAITPTTFSAAVTTNLKFAGDFHAFATPNVSQATKCHHRMFLRSGSGDRACAEVKINGAEGSCIMPRGAPPLFHEQDQMIPMLQLCGTDGRTAYAVPATGAPAAFDVALRVTNVSTTTGSFAGGTRVTIMGAGFASEDEKQVLTGLTYQYEVASNAIKIHAGQKIVPCDITSAGFNTLECITRKYTAAKIGEWVVVVRLVPPALF